MLKLKIFLLSLLLCSLGSLSAKDVLLEFKAAAFFPTNSCVKDIYGKAAALFGPEVTFQFSENYNLYGFASLDFLGKKGKSVGLCTPTTMHIMPLGAGLKYFFPFCSGDFYLGLGFQPLNLKTFNCSEYVIQTTNKWGFGGIAKVGCYVNLAHNLLMDFFADYSFVTVGCGLCSDLVTPIKVKMNGASIGFGFGYRFN